MGSEDAAAAASIWPVLLIVREAVRVSTSDNAHIPVRVNAALLEGAGIFVCCSRHYHHLLSPRF